MRQGGILQDESCSSGTEPVSAFRELITELKERNGVAEHNCRNKQERARQPPPPAHFFPYQLRELAATVRQAVSCQQNSKTNPKTAVLIKKQRARLQQKPAVTLGGGGLGDR